MLDELRRFSSLQAPVAAQPSLMEAALSIPRYHDYQGLSSTLRASPPNAIQNQLLSACDPLAHHLMALRQYAASSHPPSLALALHNAPPVQGHRHFTDTIGLNDRMPFSFVHVARPERNPSQLVVPQQPSNAHQASSGPKDATSDSVTRRKDIG